MIKTIMKVYVAFHQKNAVGVSDEIASGILLPNELDRMLRNNLFPPEEAEKAQWRAGTGEYGLQALKDLGSNVRESLGLDSGSNALATTMSTDIGMRGIVIDDRHTEQMQDLRGSSIHY